MKFEKGKKIWNSSSCKINSYVDFFAVFEKGDKIKLACDGNYALYINDRFVSTGQYPGYEDMLFFDTLDISEYADRVENTLKIIAHHPGCDFSTYRAQPAFVIFEISCKDEITCASGENTKTMLDPNFVSGENIPKVSGQLGFTFEYDSTAIDTQITDSFLVGGNEEFLPRPVKKLDISENTEAGLINKGEFFDMGSVGTTAEYMQSSAITTQYLCGKCVLPNENGIELSASEKADGIFALIDLEKESTGFLSLDIEVEKECDIFIGWGEHLADLRVRTYIGGRNFAVKYHAKTGRNRFEQPLLRLGLRYMQLHIYTKKCKLFYAGIRSTTYPLKNSVPGPTDDLLHKKIYETCIETLKLCMHEHYEDCPWREQALYTMDSRNQMLCGYYAFGETEFAAASLKLIAHSIRDDGLLELCSPAKVSITIPSFSAIFIVQLCEYLKYSGDLETPKELLPTAKKIAEAFEAHLENGLIRCFEDKKYWNFYEWQDGLSESRTNGELSFDAPLSAFVIMAYDSLSYICERLGEKDSEKYKLIADKMREAVQAFWDSEHNCYASYIKNEQKYNYSELTNSLLICAGAVPKQNEKYVLDALKSKKLKEVTLSHSIFKYEALMRDKANSEYILSDIAEKWGYMLMNGATSFWETLEGESAFANAGSLCHGWSAIPVYIYFKLKT